MQQLPARPPAGGAVGYTIGDQVQTLETAPQGRLVRGHRVYFTTAKGASSSVFVAENMYTEANVRAAVAAAAATLDALQGASG